MRVLLSAVTVLLATGIVGCGSEDDVQVKTVTVERTVEAAATQSKPASSDDGSEPAADEGGQEASVPERSDADGGDDGIRVPSVVGKDHQLAQDTMQAAGLYNLAEEDASGQDRMLLIDRNWTVVSQTPSAGTRVSEDKTIVLRSKKDGE